MTPSIAPGLTKRAFQEEERIILCAIGYVVNNTFGNAVNLNDATYSMSCSSNDVPVVGINDGVGGGTFTLIGQEDTDILISDLGNSILDNDVAWDGNAPDAFECLEVILGDGFVVGGVTSGNAATTLEYHPNLGATGLHMLRYIPIRGGIRGSITYIYMFVGSAACTPLCYNLISNGEFQNSDTTCMVHVTNEIFCWNNYTATPDLYGTDCPTYPSYDGDPANQYIGFRGNPGWEESIQQWMFAPIAPGNYTIHFRCKVLGNGFDPMDAPISFALSDGPLAAGGERVRLSSDGPDRASGYVHR